MITPKFVYLHPSHAEEMKYKSNARKSKYISVDHLEAWIINNRLSVNPLPFDTAAVAQKAVYDDLEALLKKENP